MFWRTDLFEIQEKYSESWLVLHYDINKREVVPYNVLIHPAIVEVCRESGKHVRLKSFEMRLNSAVSREFCSRAQWEMGVSDKFPRVSAEELDRLVSEREKNPSNKSYDVDILHGNSLDVATQLWMNWKQFLHFVYRHREAIVKQYEQLYR